MPDDNTNRGPQDRSRINIGSTLWWLHSCSIVVGLAMGLLLLGGYARVGAGSVACILIICAALVIARFAGANYFTNGLLPGFLCGFVAVIVIPLTKVGLWVFLCNNPHIAVHLQSGTGESEHARALLFQIAPLFASLTGLILGSLSWSFARIYRLVEDAS